jgi:predicted helicase
LENGVEKELDIKWDSDLTSYLSRNIQKQFEKENIRFSLYRPFVKMNLYFDRHFNARTYQMPSIFPFQDIENLVINFTTGVRVPFIALGMNCLSDLNFYSAEPAQCLPLYRYDKNGDRIDNITDWGLTQFQTHYSDRTITKENIFHYTYAVLHHPAYRTKYELNLKREFPRLPFYADFHQWATWGKALMELHLNYETIEPYGLTRQDIASKDKPKAKLKADKTQGIITLDENTQLTGVPAIAWDYKLGNRSALEWILDQYKEKRPKDPTIAKLFNTYKFADYKEHVIDLLQRVCTVSVKTIEIIQQMPDTVEHEGSNEIAARNSTAVAIGEL